MTFPPPPPSSQSSIASGSDKPSSTRPPRSQQPPWGPPVSQTSARRGLTPLATNLSNPSVSARGTPQTNSPGPGVSTSSPLNSSFSAVLSSSRGHPLGRNVPSPASTPGPFASYQPGSQQTQPLSGQSLASPKIRAHTPSSGSHLASAAGSVAGGGGSGGGGGGTSSSRGATFSPLLSGTTVNSPTGFSSDKPGSFAAHGSQSSLAKISIAQVFLLLDSITEKEGREKWETKAAQIHKVSIYQNDVHHAR